MKQIFNYFNLCKAHKIFGDSAASAMLGSTWIWQRWPCTCINSSGSRRWNYIVIDGYWVGIEDWTCPLSFSQLSVKVIQGPSSITGGRKNPYLKFHAKSLLNPFLQLIRYTHWSPFFNWIFFRAYHTLVELLAALMAFGIVHHLVTYGFFLSACIVPHFCLRY